MEKKTIKKMLLESIQHLGEVEPSQGNLLEEEYTYDNDHNIAGCLLGRGVSNLNAALDLYSAHARAVGFSVRKGTTRKRNDGVIFEKYYKCSREGLRNTNRKKQLPTDSTENEETEENEENDENEIAQSSITEGSASTPNQRKRKPRTVLEPRTDCKAYIRFKMTKGDRFVVVDHNTVHNHDLVKPEKRRCQCRCHHQKSDLSISKGVSKFTKTTASLGTRTMDSYNSVCNESVVEELVGHTNDLDFISKSMINNIEGCDMQNVLDVMQLRTADDDSFFYRVKVNDENQVVSIFWRDSMMLEDYIAFGDVLIFDTTYKINKYDLISAPFTGINNHGKTTMFACAFISEEKTEIYEWLLENFKKSMCGIVPKSIFTDQNLAVNYAIGKVFQTSRHRFCVWHLQENSISDFDALKNNPTFRDMFNKCLTGCENQDEFSECWTEMIGTYGLEKSFWFLQLYDFRDKWCTALSKDFFSVGILSSQRVELTNMPISSRANKTTSLFELYHIFEDTVKRVRKTEKNDNFKCSTERSPASESRCKLLKHAAEVYTRDIYDVFQKQFDVAMGSYIRIDANQDGSQIYLVSLNEDFTQSHNVLYNDQLLELSCTCMSYQECGLLCYHILRVMHMHCIFEIPQKYITKRWTKSAKSEIWTENKDDDVLALEDKKEIHTPWRHTMARNFYNLLTTCQFDEHARKIFEKGLNEIYSVVKKNIANK